MPHTIAVVTGSDGCTSTVFEGSQIVVYSNQGEEVSPSGSLNYNFDLETGLAESRQKIKSLETDLSALLDEKSKVLVAKSVTGLPYTVLDAAGYTIFEVDGKPEQFINMLFAQLNEHSPKIMEGETVIYTDRPIETEGGRYFIDLKTLQIKKPGITSKQALMSFFEKTPFLSLDIICAHIPPWFDRDFERLGLEYSTAQDGGALHIKVRHKGCDGCAEDIT